MYVCVCKQKPSFQCLHLKPKLACHLHNKAEYLCGLWVSVSVSLSVHDWAESVAEYIFALSNSNTSFVLLAYFYVISLICICKGKMAPTN